MSAVISAERSAADAVPLTGQAPPSPAGPVGEDEAVRMPPANRLHPLVQSVRFGVRPISYNLRNHRRFGDVWQINILARRDGFVVTCHPDHVRSLLKARPEDAPSLTGESPLRPILGPNSILTSIGARHMRQRKLLLPPFHGEAVQRYVAMIAEVAEREIDRWPLGEPFALAPRMSAVTLDVIMSGIFGIEGTPAPGTDGHRLRQTIRRVLGASTNPLFQLVELRNIRRREPTGVLKRVLDVVDRQLLAIIAERRAQAEGEAAAERTDILSLLIHARDEDGQPLTDRELRDELLSLVLAGHETTANQLAWTFERLLRTPEAYATLRERVRAGDAAGEAYVEATIHESMRNRPVIPMIVRMLHRPWRMGEYVLPAQTPVAVSIVALHHREDLYPEPLVFRPERFLDTKPGTYTWLPFGGGIRRCLGASLAMAEQRVVLEAIARRTDLIAPQASPERARQRNVTTIPAHGAQVIVTARDAC
ncbi:MAG TPA: cytochrome P450 [Solirubrobacteraceae bacterium]|nr:cytochrome P450 [Solirubrobacteraceae bacterium]